MDAGGRIRRSFVDKDFELYVFMEPDGSMFGFQLVFPSDQQYRLLSWTPVEQYKLHRVECGTQGLGPGRPMTILDPGEFDGRELLRDLRPAAAGLEPHIQSFVLELVYSQAEEIRRCRYCAARRSSDWHCPRCWLRACDDCMEHKTLRKSRCTWTEAAHAWAPEAVAVRV